MPREGPRADCGRGAPIDRQEAVTAPTPRRIEAGIGHWLPAPILEREDGARSRACRGRRRSHGSGRAPMPCRPRDAFDARRTLRTIEEGPTMPARTAQGRDVARSQDRRHPGGNAMNELLGCYLLFILTIQTVALVQIERRLRRMEGRNDLR